MVTSLLLSGMLAATLPAAPSAPQPVPPDSAPPVRVVQAPPREGTAPRPAPPVRSPESREGRGAQPESGAAKPDARDDKDPTRQDTTVVTRHEITLDGKPFRYTATAGMMPLKNEAGDTEARVFYVAYTADAPKGGKRPLMFSFNGGPGSSAVWLHLGAIGPRRVHLLDDGGMPPPPYRLVDNEATWLDKTDVVFIDPVGTGFSHAAKPEDNRKYWGVREDIESVAEFIRLYLTCNDRWESPLFLVGESYGTFRAAGLAGHLVENGVALNGIVLVSTVLNMGLLSPRQGGDVGYAIYLPSYAATAWYHKRLPPDLQQRPLTDVLAEVERWAIRDYVPLLARGHSLRDEERRAAAEQIARYTGLKPDFVEDSDLRIDAGRFFKEVLRDENRTVGRYDSRFTGVDADATSTRPEYDPSYAAVAPPFTMTFNNYVRADLDFRTDREYGILVSVWPWNYGRDAQGPPTTEDDLRDALVKNPYMHVLVAEGLYDLATPYLAAEYTLDHMDLTPSMRARVSATRYRAGHMMYIDSAERCALKRDVAAFLDRAASPPPTPESIHVAR